MCSIKNRHYKPYNFPIIKKMSISNYKNKINTIIDYGLLLQLQNIGICAGGSVVYFLNDFIDKNIVGDIDIFVKSSKEALQVYEIIKTFCTGNKIELVASSYKGREDAAVVNFSFEQNGKVNIQVIVKNYENPLDIVSNFDMDVVQCGFYQNNLLITENCKKAHIFRKVRFYRCFRNSTKSSGKRLYKILLKGFEIPTFYNKCALENYDVDYQVIENPTFSTSINEKSKSKSKDENSDDYKDDYHDDYSEDYFGYYGVTGNTKLLDMNSLKLVGILKDGIKFSLVTDSGELVYAKSKNCTFTKSFRNGRLNYENLQLDDLLEFS